MEHPFFVIGQGWSSYNPNRSLALYGLQCHKLQVGDICISLTHRDVCRNLPAGEDRLPPGAAAAARFRRYTVGPTTAAGAGTDHLPPAG
ncbi:MAG: hypothetical protein GY738_28935, partial [Pseudoalteromonas sp.]|nr:hypothetical protein [Pseudoalteromonas sp.]